MPSGNYAPQSTSPGDTMTEERKTAVPGAEKDAFVTDAYRDLATERVPEKIDRAVLKKARAAARPQYSRLRAWTRPMAWAATVMLSVAIVLQIGKVPGPENVSVDDASGKSEADVAAFEAVEDRAAEIPAAEALLETPTSAPVRSLNSASNLRDDATIGRAAAKQAAPEPAAEKRQRAVLQDSVNEQQPAAPATEIDAFRPTDPDMLQRAAEMAKTQSGENRVLAPKSSDADAAALGAVAVSTEAPACDESVRQTPETWLECIKELEAAGQSDEASRQRELLQQNFPEFELR